MKKQVGSVNPAEEAHHQVIALAHLDDLSRWFKRAFFEPIGDLLRAIASGDYISVHLL